MRGMRERMLMLYAGLGAASGDGRLERSLAARGDGSIATRCAIGWDERLGRGLAA